MALTFRSSIPESFALIGRDPDGRQRSVTATRPSNAFYWDLQLRHPSGQSWQAQYHGAGNAGILDAMSELMRSKDAEFKQDKARNDRPPAEQRDHNRSITDAEIPSIRPIPGWR